MNNTDCMYEAWLASRTVSTDSRRITPGCLFFALRGESFDGNAFVPEALKKGAALCVTSDARYAGTEGCLVVDDVTEALQALARERRRHLTVPVVGITGTNGKTTTKELVHAVLGRRYRTCATSGNLNNHLGVPLTLLAIPPEAEMAVVEMGANHPGEIAFLCGIADPDAGLITNVGCAHLEGFGSVEGVVRTKTELYAHLEKKGGLAFVNAADGRLAAELSTRFATLRRVTYGTAAGATVQGSHVGDTPFMRFCFEVGDRVYSVQSHLLGAYNFHNCMAAVAVGLHYGVEPWDIKEAIEAYVPSNQRSEWKRTGRNSLYLDCYNANPSSMAAAIASFSALQAEHKMAIVGGMHELGEAEREEHERLVGMLEGCGLEQCLLVGPEFGGIALGGSMRRFADTAAVREWLAEHPVSGATVLVKGSNTNRLWTLEELL